MDKEGGVLMAKTYYKTVRRDLKSWYGNVQYEVGREVSVPAVRKPKLCTDTVLHASEKPLDALKYAGKLDCTLLEVSGDEVVQGYDKSGFFSLSVVREIPDSEKDALYGFSYNEAIHPVNPCKIKCKPTKKDRENLKQWAFVSDSIGASIEAPVWKSVRTSISASATASVGHSVWGSVRDFIWRSVWGSVRSSVRNFAWGSVEDSIEDFIWIYIGSLFPAIDKWAYIDHKKGDYPLQPGVDLWKRGFIPIHVNGKWKLYHLVVGKPAEPVWEAL